MLAEVNTYLFLSFAVRSCFSRADMGCSETHTSCRFVGPQTWDQLCGKPFTFSSSVLSLKVISDRTHSKRFVDPLLHKQNTIQPTYLKCWTSLRKMWNLRSWAIVGKQEAFLCVPIILINCGSFVFLIVIYVKVKRNDVGAVYLFYASFNFWFLENESVSKKSKLLQKQ